MLDHVPRIVCSIPSPIAESGSKTVNREPIATHAAEHFQHCEVGYRRTSPGTYENILALAREACEDRDCTLGQRDLMVLASLHSLAGDSPDPRLKVYLTPLCIDRF